MIFKTGDIVLFSGKFEPHLRIQKFINNKWSQVGLLINWNNQLAIFESTKVPICLDLETNEFVNGVQVVSFLDKVNLFNGEIVIRRLQPNLSENQEKKLMTFISQVKGKPFNDSKFFMVRGKERRNSVSDNSCFLCSQLVAETLQYIEILQKHPIGYLSSNYSPSDFCSESNLHLIQGFSYSIEKVIKS